MYLKKTSSFNEKSNRPRKKKTIIQSERPWELMFAPDRTGRIGMVWTSSGLRLMCMDPKYPNDAVSSWRLRQLRELGKQLNKQDTIQYLALIEEIAKRKAAGTWVPDKYEGEAAA